MTFDPPGQASEKQTGNDHFRDGVRFEEVSLGYPRDWNRDWGVAAYLRQILPLPKTVMGR